MLFRAPTNTAGCDHEFFLESIYLDSLCCALLASSWADHSPIIGVERSQFPAIGLSVQPIPGNHSTECLIRVLATSRNGQEYDWHGDAIDPSWPLCDGVAI